MDKWLNHFFSISIYKCKHYVGQKVIKFQYIHVSYIHVSPVVHSVPGGALVSALVS